MFLIILRVSSLNDPKTFLKTIVTIGCTYLLFSIRTNQPDQPEA